MPIRKKIWSLRGVGKINREFEKAFPIVVEIENISDNHSYFDESKHVSDESLESTLRIWMNFCLLNQNLNEFAVLKEFGWIFFSLSSLYFEMYGAHKKNIFSISQNISVWIRSIFYN